MWRHRGSPHYLEAQSKRLGISKVLADRSRHNAEIYRCSHLLAQLCDRYHRAAKGPDGTPHFYGPELAQIKGTLEQAEIESHKLHMLAAAAAQMIDEAWQAFGLAAPDGRAFRVTCQYDDPPPDVVATVAEVEAFLLPFGDGTVGVGVAAVEDGQHNGIQVQHAEAEQA
jgi:hypothetical protein